MSNYNASTSSSHGRPFTGENRTTAPPLGNDPKFSYWAIHALGSSVSRNSPLTTCQSTQSVLSTMVIRPDDRSGASAASRAIGRRNHINRNEMRWAKSIHPFAHFS